jgi:excisionase family DNA binding protein
VVTRTQPLPVAQLELLAAVSAGEQNARTGERESDSARSVTARPAGGRATFQRLAVSPDEAAALLGVSRDYLDEHVIPELRVVRRGRRILIAVGELQRWLDRSAARGTVGRG